MEENRLEADDTGPLGKERMDNKRRGVSKLFTEANEKREKKTVQAPASGLVGVQDASSLLALLQSAIPQLGGAGPATKQDGEAVVETHAQIACHTVEDSDDEETRQVTSAAAWFGGEAPPPASGQSHSGRKQPPQAPRAASGSGQDDGRLTRSVVTMQQQIATDVNPGYYELINLSDERLRAATSMDEKKELNDYVHAKLKTGKQVLKHIEACLKKCIGCKAAALLSDEQNELERKDKTARACVALLNLMIKTPCDPAEFLQLIDAIRDEKAIISNNLWVMEFQQQVQQSLNLGRPLEACKACSLNYSGVERLVDKGIAHDDIAQVAVATILDSILVLASSGLSKPDQQREPASTNTTKLAIASIIACVREAKNSQHFLARDAVDSEMEDLALLVDKAADPVKMTDLVARYDAYHDPQQGG